MIWCVKPDPSNEWTLTPLQRKAIDAQTRLFSGKLATNELGTSAFAFRGLLAEVRRKMGVRYTDEAVMIWRDHTRAQARTVKASDAVGDAVFLHATNSLSELERAIRPRAGA